MNTDSPPDSGQGKLAPPSPELRVGLALSGGGVRATVFHLGVLARLAQEGLLERVSAISTVSGGSLSVGLVICHSNHVWPGSQEFLRSTAPKLRQILTSTDVQRSCAVSALVRPWYWFRGRANLVSMVIKDKWGIHGNIGDLPAEPRWIINATTFETGKNWRISQRRMGDYVFGHALKPNIEIAEAIASSAAFPALIGPLRLRASGNRWFRFKPGSSIDSEPEAELSQPLSDEVNLWDGGVYENLGIEALYKADEGLREGINFLVVSDASKPLGISKPSSSFASVVRLLEIATDQVRSLRARMFLSHLKRCPGTGVYLAIGNCNTYIRTQAGRSAQSSNSVSQCLSEDDVSRAKSIGTTLRRLEFSDYDLLFRHGFENANATLASYAGDAFGDHPYGRSPANKLG